MKALRQSLFVLLVPIQVNPLSVCWQKVGFMLV